MLKMLYDIFRTTVEVPQTVQVQPVPTIVTQRQKLQTNMN